MSDCKAVLFAPMEGVTDNIFRRVHTEMFGGVEKYFIPFVSPTQNNCWTNRQLKAISPENNDITITVPQILANNSDNFIWAAKWLHDAGYCEVNLNVGCPSGTVTAKRKGAGMLLDLDSLRRFLDNIFSKCEIHISIKTRIGFYSTDEARAIADIYRQYPVWELTVHPRVRAEQYSGTPHLDTFAIFSDMPFPVIYNGDILTVKEIESIVSGFPFIRGVMIGRGLAGNPQLALEYLGGNPISNNAMMNFYLQLEQEYCSSFPPQSVLPRLKEILRYMEWFLESNGTIQRSLRRSSSVEELHAAAMALLSQPIRTVPNNPNIHTENDLRI